MPDCRLYLITPPALPDLSAFVRRLEDAFSGGDVAALQVRLKDADERQIAEAVAALTPVCAHKDVMVILNDRPDLAARLGCDGVHIGQSDAPYDEARRLMGKDRVVGVTCHDSLHLAMEAAEAGADYVAFGAFYPTSTKTTEFRPEPDLLTGWQQDMLTPCVAIGGITVTTAADMARAGADYLAVTAGVWGYPEGPAAAVAAFNAEMARGVSERGF